MSGRAPNPYAETGLDRASGRRGDADWLAALLADPATAIVPLWRSRNLVAAGGLRAAAPTVGEAAALLAAGADMLFLGLRGGVAHFAVDLSHVDDPHAAFGLDPALRFVELREVSPDLPPQEGGLLAYARALAHWHRTHRFCGRCGHATEPREGGHVRRCTGPACGAQHFPRTDPAVIMLVSRGDRVLLGRKAEWPAGRYSVLAGFVEPGETLEAAVAREVLEEVGVPVADVRYHSSQPWPFPASLMLGFFATALGEAIRRDPDELEDARWFTRAELVEAGESLALRPRSDSIARRLLNEWVAGGPP
jgi:NAD+ diphosphatase